jgi:hypothetical protein
LDLNRREILRFAQNDTKTDFFRSLFSLSAFRFLCPKQKQKAEEPEWQLAKIDFHIPLVFSFLLKRINLRASTENTSCGK